MIQTSASNPGTVDSVQKQEVLELLEIKGKMYIYLKGVASCATGMVATFDDAGQATLLVKTEADKLKPMAVALGAVIAATFGWFQIYGETQLLAVASATKEAALYSTATAGVVDITATSQTKINRAILRANNGGAQALTNAFVNYPSAA